MYALECLLFNASITTVLGVINDLGSIIKTLIILIYKAWLLMV